MQRVESVKSIVMRFHFITANWINPISPAKRNRENRTSTYPVAVFLSVVFCSAMLCSGASAQVDTAFLDHSSLTEQLRKSTGASSNATLHSIGKSVEGRDLWMVEIAAKGRLKASDRPGLLIVANLEGDHLVGSALATEMITYLLDSEDAATVRQERVIYVLPRLNPDGAETFFSTPSWNRRGNGTANDDDNDGRTDEDPFEDLNGDGMVTQMRVLDPEGTFRVDADDARLMVKADPVKGERGTHKVYWEGTDTDHDGFFNEDGPGGTDLNRNFQHVYPYWQADSGAYMISEPESRALMDFMVSHRNIAAILTFGHTDNLATDVDGKGNPKDPTPVDLENFANASYTEIFDVGNFRTRTRGGQFFGRFFGTEPSSAPLRGAQKGRDNDAKSGRRPETSVHKDDQPYFKKVAEAYRKITGVNETVYRRAPEGAFYQFGYFQFGVPSFSTPGWGFEAVSSDEEASEETDSSDGPEDSEQGDDGPAAETDEPSKDDKPAKQSKTADQPGKGHNGKPKGGRPGGEGGAEKGSDADMLTGLESEQRSGFVDWTTYEHPQLGTVEIGGFKPYALTNPPSTSTERIAELGRKHGEFALELAGMLPRVRFTETSVTAHGGGVFSVEAEIENTGIFPTALRHGVVSRGVQPVSVQIQIEPEALLTGDAKTSTVESLTGSGGRRSFTWILHGKRGDRIEIKLRAQKGGSDTTTVTLR